MARTSLRRSVLFSLVMLVVVLGTAEALVRWLAREALDQAESPPPLAQEGAPNLVGNPYLLFEMAPGDRLDNGIHVAIDSMGLRGPEWDIEKPAGVRRIMAVGDSSVYGFGVEDDQVFTSQLAAALGPQVQVINAAVPGYSTYQTINLLEIRALALQPDILLIGSIWSDNNFDSFVDSDLLAAYSSFRNRQARTVSDLLRHAALFRLLDYKLRVLRRFPAERRVGWMVGRGEKIGKRRVPIQEYARNLETMVELAHDASAEVAFMVLPNREDLVKAIASGAAWDPYRKVMRDTAARHGAQVVELPDLFRASSQDPGSLFLDEMHPTALGHTLWAEALEVLLREHGWTDGGQMEGEPEHGDIPTYEDIYVEGEHTPPQPPEPPMDPAASAPGSPTAPQGGPNVRGVVVTAPGQEHTPLQIDAIDADAPTEGIVGSARATAAGPFTLDLRAEVVRVGFQVFLDPGGDGPSAGDPRFDLFPEGLVVPAEGLEGVVLDLTQGQRIDTFSGSAAPPVGGPPPGPTPEQAPVAPRPIVTDMTASIQAVPKAGAPPPEPPSPPPDPPPPTSGPIVTDQPASGSSTPRVANPPPGTGSSSAGPIVTDQRVEGQSP